MNSNSEDNQENQELSQIWSLFKESPGEIQERREKITQIMNDNASLSFPDQISIMTSLDELLGCFALGGQIKHYYRYGTYSNCARERKKFMFAIRNGTLYEEHVSPDVTNPKEVEKRQKVQEFYKERLLEDKAKGSSEDIWDIREKPLYKPFKDYNN